MSKAGQVCTFELDDLLCGVDVAQVREIVPWKTTTPLPLSQPVVGGLINLRGQIVTAIDLRLCLALPDRPTASRPVNLIINSDPESVSLLVDRMRDVIDPQEYDFEDIRGSSDSNLSPFIHGVYKLHNRLLLMIDAAAVVEWVSETHNT